jgi:periplasmic divalent cation tolerance protein
MIVVYVTYPSAEEAQNVSNILLEARLAACANIFPAHQSLYWWEGKIQQAGEVAVLYKTQDDLFEKFKDEVLKHHPYDVPCITSWAISEAHGAFAAWVETETLG